MSSFLKKISYWLAPKTNSDIETKVDETNLLSIHYVTLLVCVLEFISLIVYSASNIKHLFEKDVVLSFIFVGFCFLLCLVISIVTGYIRKLKMVLDEYHNRIIVFVVLFVIVFQIWGMIVSGRHYLKGEQIITFYTVELCIAIFIKLKPLISVPIILLSYIGFYVWLDCFGGHGLINRYNFIMLAVLTAAGAVFNYRLTINNIKRQNRIEILNESLERIANHDPMTRLKNRYALNQDIAGYLDSPVCIAFGDIDSFKKINDTFGHDTGDKILKDVADTLICIFDKDSVYRYGGDEFLVVKKCDDFDRFKQDVESVNTILSDKAIEKSGKRISCTFGFIKSNVSTPVDFIDLISKADKRLYEKKRLLK